MYDMSNYGLDDHCMAILQEYRDGQEVFHRLEVAVRGKLDEILKSGGMYVTGVESRIKGEASLAGKLKRKGSKYASLKDITDIVGFRVITFYLDEVDKTAALLENVFDVDRENSVDKRKIHEINRFGYMSLHYVCRIPKSVFYDPEYPQINDYKFEVQMRTALQHVWSTLEHDTGYKAGIEVPREYIRNLSRLAGMLELADEQFCNIRTAVNDYRRMVQSLVGDGKFETVSLNEDNFKNYLKLNPFAKLNRKIASINQAEISEAPIMPYLEVMQSLGFTTLADVESLIKQYSDDAFNYALFQIGNTDIDIIGSNVAIQNLLYVYIIRKGLGTEGLVKMFNIINGENPHNAERAAKIVSIAATLNIIQII